MKHMDRKTRLKPDRTHSRFHEGEHVQHYKVVRVSETTHPVTRRITRKYRVECQICGHQSWQSGRVLRQHHHESPNASHCTHPKSDVFKARRDKPMWRKLISRGWTVEQLASVGVLMQGTVPTDIIAREYGLTVDQCAQLGVELSPGFGATNG